MSDQIFVTFDRDFGGTFGRLFDKVPVGIWHLTFTIEPREKTIYKIRDCGFKVQLPFFYHESLIFCLGWVGSGVGEFCFLEMQVIGHFWDFFRQTKTYWAFFLVSFFIQNFERCWRKTMVIRDGLNKVKDHGIVCPPPKNQKELSTFGILPLSVSPIFWELWGASTSSVPSYAWSRWQPQPPPPATRICDHMKGRCRGYGQYVWLLNTSPLDSLVKKVSFGLLQRLSFDFILRGNGSSAI